MVEWISIAGSSGSEMSIIDDRTWSEIPYEKRKKNGYYDSNSSM